MRAVKSVLVMAGKLKQEEPEEDETNLLIRALRGSNIPKFLKDDLPLFNALIQDLFPLIEIPDSENKELMEQVENDFEEKSLEKQPIMYKKINELYLTLNVRFGTMIVGKAMTGKTTIINSLKSSLNKLHDLHKNENLSLDSEDKKPEEKEPRK